MYLTDAVGVRVLYLADIIELTRVAALTLAGTRSGRSAWPGRICVRIRAARPYDRSVWPPPQYLSGYGGRSTDSFAIRAYDTSPINDRPEDPTDLESIK
jgi:hypothetical protein